jgi:cytochrome c556
MKTTQVVVTALMGVTVALVTLPAAAADVDALVQKRQQAFKQNKKDAQGIKAALASGDMQAVREAALRIAAWAKEIPAAFPPDSNPPPSDARDDIWLNWEGFKQKAEDNRKAAQALADAVEQKASADTLRVRFGAVGQSCKACHDNFKN